MSELISQLLPPEEGIEIIKDNLPIEPDGDDYSRESYDQWELEMMDVPHNLEGKVVLEVFSGTYRMEDYILQRGGEYYSVDIKSQKVGHNHVLGNAMDLPFKRGSCDLIIMRGPGMYSSRNDFSTMKWTMLEALRVLNYLSSSIHIIPINMEQVQIIWNYLFIHIGLNKEHYKFILRPYELPGTDPDGRFNHDLPNQVVFALKIETT